MYISNLFNEIYGTYSRQLLRSCKLMEIFPFVVMIALLFNQARIALCGTYFPTRLPHVPSLWECVFLKMKAIKLFIYEQNLKWAYAYINCMLLSKEKLTCTSEIRE